MKKLLILLAFVPAICFGQTPLSVKEFLILSPADTTSYLVSGTVSKVRSATSGSFYLQDATGTLLVYGLKDPAHPEHSFQQMDIVKGDTLSVLGRFTVYGGSTLEMKDGRLIRKADGPEHSLSLYDRLEQKPSFKGKAGNEGLEAFRIWVQDHLKKVKGDVSPTFVVVRFVVGRNGKVQEVQVQSGGNPAQRAEAVRVVSSAPKWKPAKVDGAAVRWPFTITAEF